MFVKIRNGVMILIIIIAVFMARNLSRPLWENSYDMSYENNIIEESVVVGAFGNSNVNGEPEIREERISTFKEILDLVSLGAVPLIMYLLSILCLVDLIKSTYERFNKEKELINKTLYICFIVGQTALMGLISYYVATISFEILIIWLIFTMLSVTIVYLGPIWVANRKYR